MTLSYRGKHVSGATIEMSQKEACRVKILQLIDEGYTDKSEIYTEVVNYLQVPRPTVRRVSHNLVKELKRKVAILSIEEVKP